VITEAEINRLESDFEADDLLRAVDEIDKMRGFRSDRDHFRPPEVRDDLFRLHSLDDRLINARAKCQAREFLDLAEELDG
jgi:hypothetical protein